MKRHRIIKIDLFAATDYRETFDKLGDPLAETEGCIDFAALAVEVDCIVLHPVNKQGGCSLLSTEIIVRMLVLMRLYNLFDEQMEYLLQDRMSYKCSCGLIQALNILDQTTVWIFENRIGEVGAEVIFDRISTQLLEKGFIDATLVLAPRRYFAKEGKERFKEDAMLADWLPIKRNQKDCEACPTKKHGNFLWRERREVAQVHLQDSDRHGQHVWDHLADRERRLRDGFFGQNVSALPFFAGKERSRLQFRVCSAQAHQASQSPRNNHVACQGKFGLANVTQLQHFDVVAILEHLEEGLDFPSAAILIDQFNNGFKGLGSVVPQQSPLDRFDSFGHIRFLDDKAGDQHSAALRIGQANLQAHWARRLSVPRRRHEFNLAHCWTQSRDPLPIEIQFCCVLPIQNHRMLPHYCFGLRDVLCQNVSLVETMLVILGFIKEPINRLRLRPVTTRTQYAGHRHVGKICSQFGQSSVQTPTPQFRTSKLFHCSHRYHCSLVEMTARKQWGYQLRQKCSRIRSLSPNGNLCQMGFV